MRENVTEREHLVLPVYLNERVVADSLQSCRMDFLWLVRSVQRLRKAMM